MAAIGREEFQGWLEHPVTLQMKKQIKKDLDNMQTMLLSCDEQDLKELQGRCKAAINLIDMDYESLYD